VHTLPRIQASRRLQGFADSQELIRSLYADRRRAAARQGALYTVAEAVQIDKRSELRADEKLLMQYVESHHLSGRFVSVFRLTANDSDGELVVYLDADLLQHEAALRELLPHGDRVRFELARWSREALPQLQLPSLRRYSSSRPAHRAATYRDAMILGSRAPL